MPILWFIATCIVFLGLYLLPSIIAERRRHGDFPAILVLNILLGWTFIGWIFALVWAFCDKSGTKPGVAERLAEIEALKASGKITTDEYNRLREKILSSVA